MNNKQTQLNSTELKSTELNLSQLSFSGKKIELNSQTDMQTHDMMNNEQTQLNSTEPSFKLTPSDEIKSKILEEREYVDIKPYSHNLISLYLKRYAELEGHDKTNQLIIDFQLDELGWSPCQPNLT
jgi:hypothetical protein